MDTTDTTEPPHDEPVYVFKPAMFSAVRELRLGADAIAWRIGFASGVLRYADIRRVRVSFRPASLLNYRFLTEIWPMKGPKLEIASATWKSMVEQERLDGPYRDFVYALHRKLAQAGSRASFENGSPPFLYWPGLAVFGAASFALATLAMRALQTGATGAAAMVGAFLALFLWQAGTFFRRNRPGRYRADAVPEAVLPRG